MQDDIHFCVAYAAKKKNEKIQIKDMPIIKRITFLSQRKLVKKLIHHPAAL